MEHREVLTNRIKQNLPRLTRTQRLIADYLVNNFEQIAFKTAGSLGEEIGVSESSILRLVNTLGYHGYNDLQTLVQENLLQGSTVDRVEKSVAALDMQDSILKRSFNLDMENISRSIQGIQDNDFDQVLTWLLDAPSVYVMGLRSSATAAQFFALTLNSMLGNTKLLGPGIGDLVEQVQGVRPRDLVFIISHQRYTKDTVQTAELLHNRGIRVVAITDSFSAPLVPFASVVFAVRLESLHFMGSIVPILALINALLAGVTVRKKSEVLQSLQEAEKLYIFYDLFHSSYFANDSTAQIRGRYKSNPGEDG